MHERTRSRTTDWITPQQIIQALGPFDFDPCASTSMPWPTASHMNAGPIDGLTIPWSGRVWLNPPYGKKEIVPFLKRMADHGNGIGLYPARTDTRWFHDFVVSAATALFFKCGRISFCQPDGSKGPQNTVGSVFALYGEHNGVI